MRRYGDGGMKLLIGLGLGLLVGLILPVESTRVRGTAPELDERVPLEPSVFWTSEGPEAHDPASLLLVCQRDLAELERVMIADLVGGLLDEPVPPGLAAELEHVREHLDAAEQNVHSATQHLGRRVDQVVPE